MPFTRVCPGCGEKFIGQRRTAVYCSNRCRQRGFRGRALDMSDGELSYLLRQVADDVDAGKPQLVPVRKLRELLLHYELANEWRGWR